MENHQDNFALQIYHNKESQRFEMDFKNGNYAYLEYRWSGKSLATMHIEVLEEMRHKGIAAIIANYVLEFAKRKQVTIKPFCPYITSYIDRNPQCRPLIEASFGTLS
jgi:predicted GNAT family acetyltransferase